MMKVSRKLLVGASFLALGGIPVIGAPLAVAALPAQNVHTVDGKKTMSYIRDGLFVGGDHAIQEVAVRDIRRAANPNFERVVIDLEGNRAGGVAAAIPRPPYFQVAVSPEEKRLIVTVFGKPRLALDAKKVVQSFRKSPVIASVELLPKLEADSWTFVLGLKSERPVEVFELANPVRIIIDIRSGAEKAEKREE